jgi:hypothetical protein
MNVNVPCPWNVHSWKVGSSVGQHNPYVIQYPFQRSPRIITTNEMMTDGLLVSDVRGLGVDYNNAMHLRTDRLTSSERIHRATVAADSEHHV